MPLLCCSFNLQATKINEAFTGTTSCKKTDHYFTFRATMIPYRIFIHSLPVKNFTEFQATLYLPADSTTQASRSHHQHNIILLHAARLVSAWLSGGCQKPQCPQDTLPPASWPQQADCHTWAILSAEVLPSIQVTALLGNPADYRLAPFSFPSGQPQGHQPFTGPHSCR